MARCPLVNYATIVGLTHNLMHVHAPSTYLEMRHQYPLTVKSKPESPSSQLTSQDPGLGADPLSS